MIRIYHIWNNDIICHYFGQDWLKRAKILTNRLISVERDEIQYKHYEYQKYKVSTKICEETMSGIKEI